MNILCILKFYLDLYQGYIFHISIYNMKEAQNTYIYEIYIILILHICFGLMRRTLLLFYMFHLAD